ncbi:uncharacterized protein LOC135494747 [Lineus longissimus]|uniref:uncharacterized protein LOC135494747 n=1 Tax=Lineus longissimus TaxID=88925 RepID=UPI002B4ECB6E
MADYVPVGVDPSTVKKGKKKKGGEPRLTPVQKNQQEANQLLNVLREQLEKAKQRKDHKVADTLRKQLWVVRDIAHGVKPDMPDDLLREVISGLPLDMPGEEGVKQQQNHQGPTVTPTERKIKKLKDKLEQIVKLKERQANGEKLEENQVKKIENEESIKQELDELETIMADLKIG